MVKKNTPQALATRRMMFAEKTEHKCKVIWELDKIECSCGKYSKSIGNLYAYQALELAYNHNKQFGNGAVSSICKNCLGEYWPVKTEIFCSKECKSENQAIKCAKYEHPQRGSQPL